MDLEAIYDAQSASDSAFQRKARLLQSYYRTVFLMEQQGNRPEAKDPLRGNMLWAGEITGRNFLSKDIFDYARYRVANVKPYETIKEY